MKIKLSSILLLTSLVVFLIIAMTLTWLLSAMGQGPQMERLQCGRCGELVKLLPSGERKTIWTDPYPSANLPQCSHSFSGASLALPTTIPIGLVVLVKTDRAYGAFVVTKVDGDPELLSYNWCYRNDGKGLFSVGEEEFITSGKHENENGIAFGPFKLGWSWASSGSYWLYYSCYPDEVTPETTKVCITILSSLDSVDAADPKWQYESYSWSPKTRIR